MPFADQRRAVAGFFQDRRKCRMIRRQAEFSRDAVAQRFFETDRQPVLVATGDQRHARGGAYRGIGVGLREAHAGGGDTVDVGCGEIPPSVTGQIGIAEIVGQNKKNVGLHRALAARLRECCRSERTASIKPRSLLRSAASSSASTVCSRVRICFRQRSRAAKATLSASGDSSSDQGSAPSRWATRPSGRDLVSVTACRMNKWAFEESFNVICSGPMEGFSEELNRDLVMFTISYEANRSRLART